MSGATSAPDFDASPEKTSDGGVVWMALRVRNTSFGFAAASNPFVA